MQFEIVGGVDSPTGRFVTRITAALDEMPDGRLLTARCLAEVVGYSADHIRSNGLTIPAKYRVLHSRKVLYGNQKTIKAFTEQVQH
jgi:hypothetical protein